MVANVQQMMSLREVPWHGTDKCHIFEEPPSIMEAIEMAGMNWKVEKKPIHFYDENEYGIEIPRREALIRSDTQHCLGIVSDRYTPVQNIEGFVFLDRLVDAGHEMTWHTAGVLGEGEKVWILAKLPETYVIRRRGKQDPIEAYIAWIDYKDGTGKLLVIATPIRIVCQNTLMYALNRTISTFRMRHSSKIHDQVKDAAQALGIVSKEMAEIEALGTALSKAKATDKDRKNYALELIPRVQVKRREVFKTTKEHDAHVKKVEGQNRRLDKKRKILTGLYDAETQTEGGWHDSWWGLYNAAVEYADHEQYHRASTDAVTHSFFGGGADFKKRAHDVALEMAGV